MRVLVRHATAENVGENGMFVHHNSPSSMPTLPVPITILLVIVFIAIYVRVVKYFVDDLYLPERRVSGGDKTVWLVIIIFGSVLGILAYLLVGREN